MQLLIKIMNWLRMALLPSIIGFLIGLAIYVAFPGETGLIISFLVTISGLVLGLVWSTVFHLRSGSNR